MEINKPISNVENCDCMDGMKRFPDKFFQLAICDPEYGIGASEMQLGTGKKRKFIQGKRWDIKPPDEKYFNELFRVSVNQIIWGANHFVNYLPNCRGWIFWDKMTDGYSESYSSGELAFTSFDRTTKQFTYKQQGNYIGSPNGITTISSNVCFQKIHPTQKPVQLYKWLLKNYAKEGDKILDSHMGSQSSRIAAYLMGFDYWGYEIDSEYFEAGNKRFKEQTAQLSLL